MISYISCALLGGVVGWIELISRNRVAPFEDLRNRYALLYVATNAVASLVALFLINTTRLVRWPASFDPQLSPTLDVMVAGLAGLLLLKAGVSLLISTES